MKRIRKYLLALLLSWMGGDALAQITYEHEVDIKNQFTVMETGANALSPAWYYNLFHKSYQKDAANRNKLFYRTEMSVLVEKEKTPAEEVDSDYVSRAKIEVLNIESRSSSFDVTYGLEKSKINAKMNLFQKNINRIVACGGTAEDYWNWKTIYNCFENAIQYTKESYLTLGQRKKEFIAIYNDIVKRNAALVRQLYMWRNGDVAKQFLERPSGPMKKANHKTLAYSAKSRWEAAWGVDGFSDKKKTRKK